MIFDVPGGIVVKGVCIPVSLPLLLLHLGDELRLHENVVLGQQQRRYFRQLPHRRTMGVGDHTSQLGRKIQVNRNRHVVQTREN